jgi:hypothetical protein
VNGDLVTKFTLIAVQILKSKNCCPTGRDGASATQRLISPAPAVEVLDDIDIQHPPQPLRHERGAPRMPTNKHTVLKTLMISQGVH